MDEARRVLERLRRIRELDRSRAPAGAVLAELRQLVVEAGAWVAVEGDRRAEDAVAQLAGQLGRPPGAQIGRAAVEQA